MRHLIKICCSLLLFVQAFPLYSQQIDYKTTKEKVYLHTSHVFFTPGEELFYKIYVVNAQDLLPNQLSRRVFVEVISPTGAVLEKQQYEVTDGYAQGSFLFGGNAPGGTYTLRAYTTWMRNEKPGTIFSRQITLLKVISPRVLMTLDFPRKGYGPGDEVVADFGMKNLQQKPVARFPVQYAVSIGGNALLSGVATTDTAGKARITFRLPEALRTNDGLLNIIADYEHNKEAISRSIPITLHNIDLRFMPEGGTLVNGITTNMAFKAVNEYGKPVDVSGVVQDEEGRQVAAFESLRFGMGRFRFTPQQGRRYTAKLSTPAGAQGTYVLPAAADNGVVMNVTQKNSLLQFTLQASRPATVILEGKTRNLTHYKQALQLQAGEQTVSVSTGAFPAGIAVFTVSGTNDLPLAERIVFLGQSRLLQVKVAAKKNWYQPREKVTLEITTSNANGVPIPANLSLAVVDDKKWTLADDRQDNLLSWLLLSSELHGKIEEPFFYFKTDEPSAPAALDLLMLTNGYRYFDYEDAVVQHNKLLYAPESLHLLSGRVTDNKKAPVPSKIYLLHGLDGGKPVPMVETDTAGRFEVLGLTSDIYTLVAVPLDKSRYKGKVKINIEENLYTNSENGWDLAAPMTNIPGGNTIPAGEVVAVPKANPSPKPAMPQQPIFGEKHNGLQEVVVTAHQVTQQRLVTSSVKTVVTQENLQSVSSALQGVVTGINIVSNLPGNNHQVTMRGISSVAGSNEPLFIYNGVPVSAAEIAGNLNTVNTVTVLKDAAAVALYGARAANGVIVITGPKTLRKYRSFSLSPDFKLPVATVTVNSDRLMPVRRFYAPVYTSLDTKDRDDFRETIYWNPIVQTDKYGKATVSFYNSDAGTSFRAITEGIGYNGQPGRAETTYVSQAPVGVDIKIPPCLTTGDKALLPLVIKNNTPDAIVAEVSMLLPEGMKAGNYHPQLLVKGHGSQKILLPVEATTPLADSIRFIVKMPHGKERIALPVTIAERGFPVNISLSAAAPESWHFDVKRMVPGSLRAALQQYAALEGLTMEVITGMLREPHGCFEQTSSTTYPNIFALKYLQQAGKVNDTIRKKAMDYLQRGYDLLKRYETTAGGFEWFGRVPPQEVLTAYGLMEFTDMKEFIAVDDAMLARTKKFLLDRRDGKGGFRLEDSKSYQLRAVPYSVANTYIVYAMTKAGAGPEIVPEYETAFKTALKSNSAWELSVMANAAWYMQRPDEYHQLIALLREGYQKGVLSNGSVVGASGTSLNVETLAWYGLALVKDNNNLVELNRIVPEIIKQRSCYGFGATQSTVLTLELLTAYAKAAQWAKDNSVASFRLNQSTVAVGKIATTLFKEGDNTFSVTSTDTTGMVPYNLEVSYSTVLPENNTTSVLKLHTDLGAKQAKVGETIRMNIQVKNETTKGQPMSVAKIGIPAGLSVQPWQLKELTETGKITHYEIFDNYLVLYWMDLAPEETKTVYLDLKAEIAGTYKGKAGNVYRYYTPEARYWNEGTEIDIRE